MHDNASGFDCGRKPNKVGEYSNFLLAPRLVRRTEDTPPQWRVHGDGTQPARRQSVAKLD
jgi:hypothetical protein